MHNYLLGDFPSRGRFVFFTAAPDNYRSINADIVFDATFGETGRCTLRCMVFYGVRCRTDLLP